MKIGDKIEIISIEDMFSSKKNSRFQKSIIGKIGKIEHISNSKKFPIMISIDELNFFVKTINIKKVS